MDFGFEQKAATCLSSVVGFLSVGESALTDGLCSFLFHEAFTVLCVVLMFHQKKCLDEDTSQFPTSQMHICMHTDRKIISPTVILSHLV